LGFLFFGDGIHRRCFVGGLRLRLRWLGWLRFGGLRIKKFRLAGRWFGGFFLSCRLRLGRRLFRWIRLGKCDAAEFGGIGKIIQIF
jgi:hypothetical protein